METSIKVGYTLPTFGTIAETSPFAMRLHRLIFICLLTAFLALPVSAQNSDSSVYQVTGVPADVTADSAAHARDQALQQGERTALQQLIQRLGGNDAIATKASDEEIASMVQSFEVETQRSSAVRYIGTFTVQFRPSAVRNFLGNHNVSYVDTASPPVLVLPVTSTGGHAILWEQATPWRAAWDAGSHESGLVPVVLPAGGLDDIAVLGTDDAMGGKPDALVSLMSKYRTGGVLVAVLLGDLTKPGSSVTVEMRRYDTSGASVADSSLILSVPSDKKEFDNLMPGAVKQIRAQLEADWKQQQGLATATSTETDTPATAAVAGSATAHLPVSVPIASLAEWEQIRQKLDHVSSIRHAEIITLARGMTSIDIEFTGDVSQLQISLASQNLSLAQSQANGSWVLQPIGPAANSM